MSMLSISITFDIDCVDYTSKVGGYLDEFQIVEDEILPYLEKENIKATWFIRLDKNIEACFGEPDYLFKKHKNTINKLLLLGHSIGWHPHYYIIKNGKWIQNIDEATILKELNYLMPFVEKYNFDTVRVGWGYQTNKTMKFFNDNGFKIDSSCMARPKYKWDMTIKDWELSTNEMYHPSKTDYRIESDDNLDILEVPMTTIDMPVYTDTEKVKRYVNLSFYNEIMKEPLNKWIESNDYLVTITHPYEIQKSETKHHIISFNLEEFKKNIDYIKKIANMNKKQINYITLDKILKKG